MPEETAMAPPKHARISRIADVIASSPLADNPLLLAVAGIGFSVSFQTIAREAVSQHMPGWPPLYPVGFDAGILALILEARKLIKRKRNDLVPRALAWAFSIGTIYVNIHGSPASDWLGRVMHAAMPALWIVFLELTRHRQKADIAIVEKSDPIPLAHWILAPWPAWLLHRRMVTRRIHSYGRAVEMDLRRRQDLAALRTFYGPQWRKEAPSDLLWMLRKWQFLDEAHAQVVLLTASTTGVPARKSAPRSAGATSSPVTASRPVPGNVPAPAAVPVPGTAGTVPAGTSSPRSGNGERNGAREQGAVPVRPLRDTRELLARAREINDAWRVAHGHDISIDPLYERMKPIRRQTVCHLLRQLKAENAPPVAGDGQEGAR